MLLSRRDIGDSHEYDLSESQAVLTDIPEGAVCYLDATIFYYHLVGAPTLSDDGSGVLKRIELGRVHGVTSSVALAEATHSAARGLIFPPTAYHPSPLASKRGSAFVTAQGRGGHISASSDPL